MALGTQGTQTASEARTAECRAPMRASPLLENGRLARLLRGLSMGEGAERVAAAREFRDMSGKGADISGAFPAIRQALGSGDLCTIRNLLWAIKYARQNGADISGLLPAIEGLRRSQGGEIGSMAGWFTGGPSTG